jgi:hypothetical protein
MSRWQAAPTAPDETTLRNQIMSTLADLVSRVEALDGGR